MDFLNRTDCRVFGMVKRLRLCNFWTLQDKIKARTNGNKDKLQNQTPNQINEKTKMGMKFWYFYFRLNRPKIR